jgi:predicted enzyme related to lactoylglutathione lyase
MTDAATNSGHRPVWIDLSTSNADGSRAFYSKLFGWEIEVSPDPEYGGYGRATIDGRDAAGLTPAQDPSQPTHWNLYSHTDDVEATARSVEAAGGTVAVPPLDIPGQGRMSVFQDPTGAFISAWQPAGMTGFQASGANTFAWAEINARGIDRAISFYDQVFGWTTRRSPMGDGTEYNEFQVDGESVAGAIDLPPGAPASVFDAWLIYFGVPDVDATFATAIELGASAAAEPQEFPGGRFALVVDPQGASFGLMRLHEG